MPVAHYRDLDASRWSLNTFTTQSLNAQTRHIQTAGAYSPSIAGNHCVISCWMKMTGGGGTAFGNGNGTVDGQGWFVSFASGGTVGAGVRIDTGGGDAWDSSRAVNDGNWHHVAFYILAGANGFTAYVDGVGVGMSLGGNLPSFNNATSNPFKVGGMNNLTGFWGGDLAQIVVLLSATSLSGSIATIIADLYNGGLPQDVSGKSWFSKVTNWWYCGNGDTNLLIADHVGSQPLNTSSTLNPGDIVSVAPTGSGVLLGSGGLAPAAGKYFVVDPQVVNTLGGTKTSTINATTLASSAIVQSTFDPVQPSSDFTSANWIAKGWTDPTTFATFKNEVRDWVHNNLSNATLNPGSNEFDLYLVDKTVTGTRYLVPIVYLGNDGPSIDFLDASSLMVANGSAPLTSSSSGPTNGYTGSAINSFYGGSSQAWTFSGWVRGYAANGSYGQFYGDVSNAGAQGLGVYLNDGSLGSIYIEMRNASPQRQYFRTTQTGYNDGNWHHVVLTYDPTLSNTNHILRTTVYVDGVAKALTVVTSEGSLFSFTPTAPPPLGQPNQAVEIDDMAWLNIALTSGQVTSLYNTGHCVDVNALFGANLVHWWRMGDGVGDTVNTIYDQKGSLNFARGSSGSLSPSVP